LGLSETGVPRRHRPRPVPPPGQAHHEGPWAGHLLPRPRAREPARRGGARGGAPAHGRDPEGGQVGVRRVTRTETMPRRTTGSKLVPAGAAAQLARDGATVGVEGAGRLLLAEAVMSAIERRFLTTGHPRRLTLLQPCGFGDDGDAGASHFAHEGLVRRVISPGWGDSPRMARLALADRVEAYCFPQGVVGQMVWCAASRKPRVVSHVGLDTFVDP